MQHCDEETLALIALGEPGTQVDDEHLRNCPRCQSQLDQLLAVVATARSITPDDVPVEAPQHVWEAIARETGADAEVVSLDSRRHGTPWLLVAAAAVVGLVAGAAVTAGVMNSSPNEQVLAQAELAPIAESSVRGTALVEQADGTAVLVVSVPDLPTPDDGYYEVWMATADTSTMVAIGTLNAGSEGRYVLPSGMDMTSFPVVDVSLEHFDGDTAHSATSVVRGQLSA